MKKTTLIISMILITGFCFGQKNSNPLSQQKDSTAAPATYVITGPAEIFRLLYTCVNNPDDITNNQRKKLADWMNKSLFVMSSDTTRKNK
jgi:hypothetical protein